MELGVALASWDEVGSSLSELGLSWDGAGSTLSELGWSWEQP